MIPWLSLLIIVGPACKPFGKSSATIVIGRKFGMDDEGNPKKLDEVELEVVPAANQPEPEPAAVGAGPAPSESGGSKDAEPAG